VRSAFAAVLLLLLFAVTTAAAQTVRGEVRDTESGEPLPGVFVVLSAGGVSRVGVLTDSAGRFFLRAPGPGQYQLSAQRIGYNTSTTAAFALAADEVHSTNLTLAVAALRLADISVRGERRCGANVESAASTARLWEEARKVLSVAAWLERDAGAQFRVRFFDRELDTSLRPASDETMRIEVRRGQGVFGAVPADSLLRFGFVQRRGEEWLFFGPDADVITSTEFLDQHCFWTERSKDRPGMVGLGFEPIRGRRISDIKGVLWIEERTSALRFVEYDFVNMGFFVDRKFAGGRTEYTQLPNGAWVISLWEIRMPNGGRAILSGRLTPEGVSVTGGEVLDAIMPGGQGFAVVPSYAVTGIVWDSLRSKPLAEARVHLPATPFRALTNERGEFRIDSVPRGVYYITFSHARLEELPVNIVPARLNVDSTTRPVRLATPRVQSVLDVLCPPQMLREIAGMQMKLPLELGAARVTLLDANTAEPLRDLKFSIAWFAVIPALNNASGPRALESVTNELGQAIICGLPLNTEFEVTVKRGDRILRASPFRLPDERMIDVKVRLQ
jgi:hypothetical protein